jgi:hypothetical protein
MMVCRQDAKRLQPPIMPSVAPRGLERFPRLARFNVQTAPSRPPIMTITSDMEPNINLTCNQFAGRGEWVFSKKWRQQVRERMLGNQHSLGAKRTEEHKQIIGYLRRGRPGFFKGKHFSEEHKRRISEANIGKIVSPETGAKISAAKLGKKHTAKSRANMARSHIGHKHSPETIAKMADARRAYHARKKLGRELI